MPSHNMITDADIRDAARAVLAGGLVVYPTETAYALGANALRSDALAKFYALKGRGAGKPTHISVLTLVDAEPYAEISDGARRLAEAFLPGALSLVLPTKGALPAILEESGGRERGIRVPAHSVARKLLAYAGVPITAASANKSGDPAPYSVADIEKSFGGGFARIAVVLDAGVLPDTLPSTLLSLMDDPARILRPGPVSRERIEKILGEKVL